MQREKRSENVVKDKVVIVRETYHLHMPDSSSIPSAILKRCSVKTNIQYARTVCGRLFRTKPYVSVPSDYKINNLWDCDYLTHLEVGRHKHYLLLSDIVYVFVEQLVLRFLWLPKLFQHLIEETNKIN